MNKKLNKKCIIILELFFIFILLFYNLKKNEEFSYFKGIDDGKLVTKIPIFTFHRLVPDDVKNKIYPYNEYVGSIKIFHEMIKYIYNKGYKTISTKEFYKWYIGEIEFNKKTILITIDDGFYEDYYLVYPIIKKYKFKATSFIVGKRIKEKTPLYNKYMTSFLGIDVINKVRKEYPYFEFQSHSFNMHFILKKNLSNIARIKTMSYEELENDICKNEKYGFTSFSYPYGTFNKEIKEILKKHGFLISFRFGPPAYATRSSDRFAIPRIKINSNATVGTIKEWLKYI